MDFCPHYETLPSIELNTLSKFTIAESSIRRDSERESGRDPYVKFMWQSTQLPLGKLNAGAASEVEAAASGRFTKCLNPCQRI